MEVETQTESIVYYVLNVFNTRVRLASNVAIFTDVNRAHKIKRDIEKVTPSQINITAIPEDGLNKVNNKYTYVFDMYPAMDTFNDYASKDPSSFFGWLKRQTHNFHEKSDACVEDLGKDKVTQTHPCELFAVTHFCRHVKNSNVVGLFTCPLLAQRVQECVLHAYGLTLADTMDDTNLIDLRGFDTIDPKVVCPYYLNSKINFT
jgi:hypothetical protein